DSDDVTWIDECLAEDLPLPENVRVGFSAATGAGTQYQEVRMVSARSEPAADLSILKEVLTPQPVAPGSPVEYRITVRNNGPDVATDVQVVDEIVGPFNRPLTLGLGGPVCTL